MRSLKEDETDAFERLPKIFASVLFLFSPHAFSFSIVSLSDGCRPTSCSMCLLCRVVFFGVRDDAGVAWLLMRQRFPGFVFCSHHGTGTNEPTRAFRILFLTTCLFSSFHLAHFLNSQTLNFSHSEFLFSNPRRAETGSYSLFSIILRHRVTSLVSVSCHLWHHNGRPCRTTNFSHFSAARIEGLRWNRPKKKKKKTGQKQEY